MKVLRIEQRRPLPRITPFSAFLCCSYPNPHPRSAFPPPSHYSVLIQDIDLLANVLMDSRGISSIVDFHFFILFLAYRNDFLPALRRVSGLINLLAPALRNDFLQEPPRKLTNNNKIEFFSPFVLEK